MYPWLSSIAILLFGAGITAHAGLVVPGATWTDTSGNVIQAHGGGFLKVMFPVCYFIYGTDGERKVGSTYYWYGEDKSHNSGLFKAVSCYSVRLPVPRALVSINVYQVSRHDNLGPPE